MRLELLSITESIAMCEIAVRATTIVKAFTPDMEVEFNFDRSHKRLEIEFKLTGETFSTVSIEAGDTQDMPLNIFVAGRKPINPINEALVYGLDAEWE